MDGQVHDRAWLRQQLAQALSWDETVVDGLVEAICSAKDMAEVEDMVSNFMADSEEGRRIVFEFATARERERHVRKDAANGSAGPSGREKNKQEGSMANGSRTKHRERKLFDPRGRVGPPEKLSPSRSHASSRPQAKQKTDSAAKPLKGRKDTENKDLNVQRSPPERKRRDVVNCLGCGKIYDCRKEIEAVYKFIDSGGICSFCGTHVRLYVDQDLDVATQESRKDYNDAQSDEQKVSEGERKALEVKNRLVDYDRNSAQRTTVLDDQSDYFEIETNVWLEENEKRELRERRELEDEVEKSLRKKVHYTIDLLGRRVFVSKDPTPAEEIETIAEAARVAAQSTSQEIPQGGGTAAQLASRTASRLATQQKTSDLHFRVYTNPDIKITSPIFLPSASSLESTDDQEAAPKWIQGYKGRLQHDDIFAAFDEEVEPAVVAKDLSAYSGFFNEFDNGPFDLCPETGRPSTLPSIDIPKSQPVVSANARLSSMLIPKDDTPVSIVNCPDPPRLNPQDTLPDGMVLMKNWLTFEVQLRIVEAVRNLGIGAGGFYTPPDKSMKSRMKFKMMCLGLHWNPIDRVYEKTRSDHDGAAAPQIPEFVKELVHQCMKDANRLRGTPFAKIDPNICICNYYAQDSLLHLHQDVTEGAESLKREIPVVSFSIGATGEFVISKTRSMETAQSILLESGDALVFGGPSRMLFHGIRKIFPESMPHEVADFTGMRNGRLNLTVRQFIPDPP